jgi:hypothetical protein
MADPTQRDGDEEPEVHEQSDCASDLIEDPGDPGEVRSKYDPALIRVDPRTFSLHQIIDMLRSGNAVSTMRPSTCSMPESWT